MNSDLNSVTSIIYVAMSFWLLKASMHLMKGEVQRGLIDLRASPQVKIQAQTMRGPHKWQPLCCIARSSCSRAFSNSSPPSLVLLSHLHT